MPKRRNIRSESNDVKDKNEKLLNTNKYNLLMEVEETDIVSDNDSFLGSGSENNTDSESDNSDSDAKNDADNNINGDRKNVVLGKFKKTYKENYINKNDNNDNVEEAEIVDNEVNIKTNVYVPPSINNDGWIATGSKKKRDYDKQARKNDGEQLKYYDPSVELNGDSMKLNTLWTVWIHDNNNDGWGLDSYKSIYNIDNIGNMWRFLSVFDNLDKNIRQYYIMREGITPIWEDNNNKDGAICSIMIENMNRYNRHSRGDLGVDAFTAICILVMNESFVKNNMDINGLCYSIKNRNVLIKLWVKDFEINQNFIDCLPISLLQKLDTIISMMESKGNTLRYHGKSRVSVQIKQIKPNY